MNLSIKYDLGVPRLPAVEKPLPSAARRRCYPLKARLNTINVLEGDIDKSTVNSNGI